MNLDDYVAALSPTHEYYLDDIRTNWPTDEPMISDFELLMEVDRRARIDGWFRERRDQVVDYCRPDTDYPDMYKVILSDTYEVMVVKLEDDLVTRAGDPV